MSYKTALESLEAALQLAEDQDDELMSRLIAGQIEATKAMHNAMADLSRKVAALESQVRHLR